MSMLHIVNKSPFEKNSLESCFNTSKADSTVLLIEDAVVGALKNTAVSEKVSSEMSAKRICVLRPDLNARGFKEDDIIDGITTVDYAGFVDLVADNDNVQSWM